MTIMGRPLPVVARGLVRAARQQHCTARRSSKTRMRHAPSAKSKKRMAAWRRRQQQLRNRRRRGVRISILTMRMKGCQQQAGAGARREGAAKGGVRRAVRKRAVRSMGLVVRGMQMRSIWMIWRREAIQVEWLPGQQRHYVGAAEGGRVLVAAALTACSKLQRC